MVSHLISSKTGIWTRATWLQTPHTSLPCCSSLWFTKELEQEMAIHSSTLAWRIPWTEELGGLQSIGSQRVGHDWATSLSLWPHKKTQNKRQPLTLHSFTLPLFQGGVWTLCDPVDCSLPGSSFFFFFPDSSVHGIFQARVLEWVSIAFSRRSSWPRDWTWVSRIVGRRFTIWATRGVPKKKKEIREMERKRKISSSWSNHFNSLTWVLKSAATAVYQNPCCPSQSI